MHPGIFRSGTAALAPALLALALASHHAGAADSQRPEISFAIHRMLEKNVEGPDVERSYFMAGGQRIIFGTPKGCRLSADDGGLLIFLNDAGLDGEIHVHRSSFTPEFDLAQNALQYRDAASRTMPAGADRIVVQQPMLNAYPYNGWKSLGFTWTYALSGRPMTRTVGYINLEIGVQVVVTTLAAQKDAEKVDKMAKEFMSSWWVKGG